MLSCTHMHTQSSTVPPHALKKRNRKGKASSNCLERQAGTGDKGIFSFMTNSCGLSRERGCRLISLSAVAQRDVGER